VAIVALATIAVAAAATLAMTTQYTATTRLYFAVEGTESVTDLAQGWPVLDRLDLETTSIDLAQTVTAVIPPDTVILEISAVDSSYSSERASSGTRK
jgi:tyrosine-protein kinase